MNKTSVHYSIRLPSELDHAMEKICARRRNLTKKMIIEAALKEYLYPEGSDKRDVEFSRFMDRIERRLKADERYLEIIGETLSLYIRVWLTQTHELPEEQKDLAERIGGRRYQKFLEILGQSLQGGRSIFEELPGEVYCSKESFFKVEEEGTPEPECPGR